MSKQTALKEFIKWGDKMMKDYPMKELGFGQAIDKAVELLELERQQIKDDYKTGFVHAALDKLSKPDEYYKLKYGNIDTNPLTSTSVDCHNSTNISDKEISDEEIEKASFIKFPILKYSVMEGHDDLNRHLRDSWVEGIEWYREQSKSKI